MIVLLSLFPFYGVQAFGSDAAVLPAINVGVTGVVGLESFDWQGERMYFGPGVTIPLNARVHLAPHVTFGAFPVSGVWGFEETMLVEYSASRVLSLAIAPSLLQEVHNGHVDLCMAIGPALGLHASNGVSLALMAQAATSLSDTRWSVDPTVNLSVPFPRPASRH